MKRAIIVGFGAIIGMSIATRLSRRMREGMNHQMREHCKQMATHCRKAAQFADREAVGRT